MRESNCTRVHNGKAPGPCVSCGKQDISGRYTHLVQKKQSSSEYYNYVKNLIKCEDSDCICRACDMQFTRKLKNNMKRPLDSEQNPSVSKIIGAECSPSNSVCLSETTDLSPEVEQGTVQSSKGFCLLKNIDICDKTSDHETAVNMATFQSCFGLITNNTTDIDDAKIPLCSVHYKQYKNFRPPCFICEKNTIGKRVVHVINENTESFKVYLTQELQVDIDTDISNALLYMACYNHFNRFVRSDEAEVATAKTDKYLTNCLEKIEIDSWVNTSNVDMFCFKSLLEYVIQNFLSYQALLLPNLFLRYKGLIDTAVVDYKLCLTDVDLISLQHDVRWLFKMLKCSLGLALKTYVPPKRNTGRLLYRYGTDLLRCLHTSLLSSQTEIEKLTDSNKILQGKFDSLLENSELRRSQYLDDTLTDMRNHIKSYVKESEKLPSLPGINSFNLLDEILKISPVLWNFILRLTANEEEEKYFRHHFFTWNDHNIHDIEVGRLFPRLFIASCVFNAQNNQCVKPLHLLITDIAHKYSNSSADFLNILENIGAGISKDSIKRYIANMSMQISEHKQILTDSFAVASFDNLDKNQAYALVGSGKEKSGFHGTTVQSFVPRPSEKYHESELLHHDANDNFSKSLIESTPSTISTKSYTHDRTIPSEYIKLFKEPENKIGEPSSLRFNRFNHLKLEDFSESGTETFEWGKFEKILTTYGVLKHFVREKGLVIPGVKTYLSQSDKTTEKSNFTSIAVLEDPADNKETVLKTLNILHSKFEIGDKLQYLVVVGDGKSYDHLIKLKTEYGQALNWVLPYPGDWHILKNVLPILIKIYYDAGLKELATKFHRGATLKVLCECTKFSITHRFFVHVWEAMLRYQVKAYSTSTYCNDTPDLKKDFDELILSALDMCDITLDIDADSPDILNSKLWMKILESKANFEFVMSGSENSFKAWREANCDLSDTFKFWDNFIHVDFMAYMGLYIGIRSRNWDLRNASLKKLVCLFYAFDRHNYIRMIPYHMADLMTFPKPVLDHFRAGCFCASISGENFYSVAADEAHEMEINLKTKQAIHSFSPASLSTSTLYLPYRAETLYNLKSQLGIVKSKPPHHREVTVSHIRTEEMTLREYINKLNTSVLFSNQQSPQLQHIFTREVATKDQSDSLLNYREYGTADLENYINCFLIKPKDVVAKQPARKRRNLKTFSTQKVTVQRQKKEIQDSKTVITCLRKQIAFSKLSKVPVTDLDQFITLPRAISDADGIPVKGQKSYALHPFRSLYKEAFVSSLPPNSSHAFTAVVIEGMFIINTVPLPQHKTFADYADFLFTRWIVKMQNQYKASEVHLVFDDPNRHGTSPKDFERARRDKKATHEKIVDIISQESALPTNWRNFLAVREHKRSLVNFLSYHFVQVALRKFPNFECTFITAGGFDDHNKDKALGSFHVGIHEMPLFTGDHEEGDTRVWLHAMATTASRVIIYSPDTDTFFIGLPLVESLGDKSVFVQLKESSYENEYIDMNCIVALISNDILLQGFDSIGQCMQMLYICSGCDFVSFFQGYGKKTFFDCFRKSSKFISGKLNDCSDSEGLLAFYKLVLCVYFSKHRAAFYPAMSVEELYTQMQDEDGLTKIQKLIKLFREKMWERILSEVDLLPSAEALHLHWKRCCWVYKYWQQAFSSKMALPSLSEHGWALTDNVVSIVWDSETNVQKVKNTIDWYTKGCACKSGCKSNRCSCRRSKSGGNEGFCGPGCKCQNCVNIPNVSDDIPSDEELAEYVDESDSDTEEIAEEADDITVDLPPQVQQYYQEFIDDV